jgi:U2 small nuclear ribonucleoprotein A'
MSADSLLSAPIRLAPTQERERELFLRGWRLPAEVENLSVLVDHGIGAIDISETGVQSLSNFPVMPGVRILTACNNSISKVSIDFPTTLPFLDVLVLTGNRLSSFPVCEPLLRLKSLSVLSLLGNPVTRKQHYRLLFIHSLPNLRLLDLSRVSKKERDEAKALFSKKKGKALIEQLLSRGAGSSSSSSSSSNSSGGGIEGEDASKKRKRNEEPESSIGNGPSRKTTKVEGSQEEKQSAKQNGGTVTLSAKDTERLEYLLAKATTAEQLNAVEAAMKKGGLALHELEL